jgi:NADH:ubiquinone oxidoreductase subunit 2 (subunit N)
MFIFLFFIISRNVFLLDKIYNFEYIYLILLSLYGSFIILFTKNLFILFIAIEIQMLCYYILASLKRYSNFATEAGIKYFLLGTFSSSLLLFGISLIYGIFGSLDIYNVFFLINYNSFFLYDILLFFSFFFFFSGLMFKLGAAPFH